MPNQAVCRQSLIKNPKQIRLQKVANLFVRRRFDNIMKSTATVLLVLSLVANVFLLSQKLKKTEIVPESKADTQPIEEAKNASGGTSTESKPLNSASLRNAITFDWQQVESEDYQDYIANLRSIGCPEETIRDIIKADVDKLYDSKLDELKPEKKPFEYWKTGNTWMASMQPDMASLEEQNALKSEKRSVLKALLGEEYEPETDWLGAMAGFNPFDQMLDFLSPTKKAEVMETYQKFAAKQSELAMNGAMDQEDMKALQDIQKERDLALAQLLTPEEKRDFDLRMSDTAMMLRAQLTGFEPTKEEFEQIFELKKAFDDEHGGIYGMAMQNQEDRQAYQTAQNEYEDGLKSILGEERYGDYKMGQDYNYKGLQKTSERYGADPETAKELYHSIKTAQVTAQEIRNNANLDQAQKREMLQGIRGETEALLVDSFGQEGFEKYSKENYARWLDRLDQGFTDEAIMDEAMMQRYGLEAPATEATTEAIAE